MTFRSAEPPEVEAATFAQRWAEAVEEAGERVFLVFEDSKGRATTWTYRQWDVLVARTAGRLADLGIEEDTRVHLVSGNSPTFIAIWLACARLGATMVPSDPRAPARELAAHAERIRPTVVICTRSRAAEYIAAVQRSVIRIDEDDPSLGELVRGRRVEGAVARSGQVAGILFTSGTTSIPKGVMVTQGNYAFAGDVMASAARLCADHRYFVTLPLFHANAQYYSLAAAISAGASTALMRTFSASRFLDQAARYSATHASLFAAPIRMILAKGASSGCLLRLRHCWYAQNLSETDLAAFAALVRCRPRQLYGMTETIPAVLTQRPLDHEAGVMGEPTLGCDVELRPPDASGAVGEIMVRGIPGRQLFAGYLDDAASTRGAFADDWFLTGDLASRDADGRFRFAGRRGDLLKVAGENVSTVEIETVLASHPAVLEAAVVGVPDPVRDEVPIAYVVQTPGADIAESDLRAFADANLAAAKRPRDIRLIADLPRTSVGKVRKHDLARAAQDGG